MSIKSSQAAAPLMTSYNNSRLYVQRLSAKVCLGPAMDIHFLLSLRNNEDHVLVKFSGYVPRTLFGVAKCGSAHFSLLGDCLLRRSQLCHHQSCSEPCAMAFVFPSLRRWLHRWSGWQDEEIETERERGRDRWDPFTIKSLVLYHRYLLRGTQRRSQH